MNLRPFGPEILRVSFQVFSCRQCYKKETLQNDMGRHGKTHSVADSLQQNADTDQRQCKTWMQPCIKINHKKPLEVRIIYHDLAVKATGQKVATMMPSSAGGHFVILLQIRCLSAICAMLGHSGRLACRAYPPCIRQCGTRMSAHSDIPAAGQ